MLTKGKVPDVVKTISVSGEVHSRVVQNLDGHGVSGSEDVNAAGKLNTRESVCSEDFVSGELGEFEDHLSQISVSSSNFAVGRSGERDSERSFPAINRVSILCNRRSTSDSGHLRSDESATDASTTRLSSDEATVGDSANVVADVSSSGEVSEVAGESEGSIGNKLFTASRDIEIVELVGSAAASGILSKDVVVVVEDSVSKNRKSSVSSLISGGSPLNLVVSGISVEEVVGLLGDHVGGSVGLVSNENRLWHLLEVLSTLVDGTNIDINFFSLNRLGGVDRSLGEVASSLGTIAPGTGMSNTISNVSIPGVGAIDSASSSETQSEFSSRKGANGRVAKSRTPVLPTNTTSSSVASPVISVVSIPVVARDEDQHSQVVEVVGGSVVETSSGESGSVPADSELSLGESGHVKDLFPVVVKLRVSRRDGSIKVAVGGESSVQVLLMRSKEIQISSERGAKISSMSEDRLAGEGSGIGSPFVV